MRRNGGFTLVEIMVSIGIVVLLAGIVFAAMGPARERARETVCSSNLHQIGMAYALYSADYDGNDAVKGVPSRYSELGLPSDEEVFYLFNTYLKSSDVRFCPSYRGSSPLRGILTTYIGYSVDNKNWADFVAQRGPDLPLYRCDWHNASNNPERDFTLSPPWSIWRYNILRLGGQVRMVHISRKDDNPWNW